MYERYMFFLLILFPHIFCSDVLYLDGINVNLNLQNIPQHHFYEDDIFRETDLASLLNTPQPIVDVQPMARGFTFVQAGNELFVLVTNRFNHPYELYNQVFVNPKVKSVAQDVKFFKAKYTSNSNEVHLVYISNDDVYCSYGFHSDFQFAATQTFTCKDLAIPGIEVTDISIASLTESYILFSNSELFRFTTTEFSLLRSNVKQVAYPALLTNDNQVWDITSNNQIEISGDIPQSIVDSSDKDMGYSSFMVIASDRSIYGYNFEYSHPLFSMSCPSFVNPCTALHTHDILHITYTQRSVLIVDTSSKVFIEQLPSFKRGESPSVRTTRIPHDMNRRDASLWKFSAHQYEIPAYYVWIDLSTNTVYHRSAINFNWFISTLTPIQSQFQRIEELGSPVSQMAVLGHEVYYLMKNGDLVHEGDVMAENIHSVVVWNSNRMIYTDTETVFLDNGLSFTIESGIKKIGIPPITESSFYVLTGDNLYQYYIYDGETFQLNLEGVFDNVYSYKDNTIFQKNGAFYCGYANAMCCNVMDESIELGGFAINRIDLSILDGKEVKDIVVFDHEIIFLTTDGYLYGCGEYFMVYDYNLNKKNADKRGEIGARYNMYPVAIYDNSDKICEMFTTGHYTLYVRICNTNKVLHYGYRPNQVVEVNSEGHPDILSMPHFGKLPVPEGLRLKSVAGTSFGALMIFQDDICVEEICEIDELTGDGGTIVLPNSTIVTVSGPSVIGNTTVIINNGTTVIIEDTLTVSNSTITYQIPNQDILESIQDGDRIVIIDASRGRIDGEFEAVKLDYDDKNTCKEVDGTLDQNDKEVAIIFRVDRSGCQGFPWWAVLLIVIGVILIATVILIIVLKKTVLKSRMGRAKSSK